MHTSGSFPLTPAYLGAPSPPPSSIACKSRRSPAPLRCAGLSTRPWSAAPPPPAPQPPPAAPPPLPRSRTPCARAHRAAASAVRPFAATDSQGYFSRNCSIDPEPTCGAQCSYSRQLGAGTPPQQHPLLLPLPAAPATVPCLQAALRALRYRMLLASPPAEFQLLFLWPWLSLASPRMAKIVVLQNPARGYHKCNKNLVNSVTGEPCKLMLFVGTCPSRLQGRH